MARNERNRTHSGEQLARQEENKKNEAMEENNPMIRYDLDKLKEQENYIKYSIDTENKFETLLTIQKELSPEQMWQEMKEIVHIAANNSLGKKKTKKTKPWRKITQ